MLSPPWIEWRVGCSHEAAERVEKRSRLVRAIRDPGSPPGGAASRHTVCARGGICACRELSRPAAAAAAVTDAASFAALVAERRGACDVAPEEARGKPRASKPLLWVAGRLRELMRRGMLLLGKNDASDLRAARSSSSASPALWRLARSSHMALVFRRPSLASASLATAAKTSPPGRWTRRWSPPRSRRR